MPDVLLLLVALLGPFGELFLSDGTVARVPVLPAFAVPRTGGGWLPTPPPPSVAYLLGVAAAAGRQPGDFVVSRILESQELGAARQFPPIGKGRHWVLHYRCDVFGPDGPYTIYVDRNAIVRVP
ncbi:hypothetical protein [Frigoriglobus tundricola]|uniref:Uncharacterized protein n=1 Tax=Frigoriglobus tundricola TaxID=2774151 RepID=A0A6M5YJQ2_9BACT|nr:hypothetical protein [Frigoriglobus tundricola]QJW94309.1 hypothetical protein FTUN_1829 [Frigoriglobus tundricola]